MPPAHMRGDGRKAKDPKKTLLRLLSYLKHYIPTLRQRRISAPYHRLSFKKIPEILNVKRILLESHHITR